MLLPSSRAWTLSQKWMLASGIAVAVVACSVGIYTYERYYRGPSEEALVGTWQSVGAVDERRLKLQFRSGHAFTMFIDDYPSEEGRWFAGGKNIYLRAEDPSYTMLIVCQIDDLSSGELRFHFAQRGMNFLLKRTATN